MYKNAGSAVHEIEENHENEKLLKPGVQETDTLDASYRTGNSFNPHEKLRELKQRDRRLTELAQNQSTCWAFIRQRRIKEQGEIFSEHLADQRLVEAVPLAVS